MSTPSEERLHWNNIDHEIGHDLHGLPPYDVDRVAARILGPTERLYRILDMGCGIGRLTNLIATLRPQAEVFGFDVSANAIAKASLDAPRNVAYMVGNGRLIPSAFPDTFDLIYSVTMLQHVPHVAKYLYLDNAIDSLAPGGVMKVTLAVGNEPKTFLNHQMDQFELDELALYLAGFGQVTVSNDTENDWTWIEVRT